MTRLVSALSMQAIAISFHRVIRLAGAGAAAAVLYSLCLMTWRWSIDEYDPTYAPFVLLRTVPLGVLLGVAAGLLMDRRSFTHLWQSVALALLIGILAALAFRYEFFRGLIIGDAWYPPYEPLSPANENSLYLIGWDALTLTVAGPLYWFVAF